MTETRLRMLLTQHAEQLSNFDPAASDIPPTVVDRIGEILEAERSEVRTGAPIISVTSGKGGVGKTSLSVNLATELASRGLRTVLVDVDLGLSNAHILAGLKPDKTLSDFIAGRADLAEIVMEGPQGVKLISGGSGVASMANLDEAGRQRILDAVRAIQPHCDVVLLDTGAGIAHGVTDFVSISDHVMLVTTSNFAAIADAYGLVKVVVQSGYEGPIHAIINRVRSQEEGEQVFQKLQGCSQRFLGFQLNWLGLLPEDQAVEGAVLQRTPFREACPTSVVTRYLEKLATAVERYLPAVPTKV